jgi:catechol 2,3-dioxygenase-like lactoylglutathione lyase family enzyme
MFDAEATRKLSRPQGLPFQIGKIGHIVINVRDVAKSTEFYTQVLGFQISDVYPDEMVPGGMVFMRCNTDHHGIALVGSMTSAADNVELNHIAFEVPSLDDVIRARDHLRRHQVPIDCAGRRRAGCQIAVEFRDPDNHRLEIYWGIDQIGSDGRARPAGDWNGKPSIEAAIAEPVPGQDLSLREPKLLAK